jgi:signal transduction histidine kinase
MSRGTRLAGILLLPVRRLRGWIGHSILNRLTAISLGTAILLLVVVALIAFPLFYRQVRSINEAHDRNKLERADEQARFRGSALIESLEQLAANSFVVNAFVDSTGRELYLLPTLRDYRPPFGVPHTLTLLDSNLSIFGDTLHDARLAPIESTLARLALGKGKTQLAFDDAQGSARLLIAVPVYYPPASSYEGVLLSSVDAPALLQPAAAALEPTECLTISHHARTLLSTRCNADLVGSAQSMSSSLANRAEGDVALTITFADAASPTFGLTTLILLAYALLSILALLVVFAATRYIGRPFAAKLEELARAADELAANPGHSVTARWEHPDEIGRLTAAFDTMVEKWREIQSSLEERVERRTAQLAQALERARESDRAKSEFLAVMSHEIRTPMNGVVGMIQVLETTPLSQEQRRQLQVIRGSSDLLLRILDDLLDFSKIEAGKLALENAPLRIDLLVKDVIASLLPAATARGVDLQVQPIAVALSETVSGDATRLRQMLTNLVHNAVKFTEAGGHVHVAVTAHPHDGFRRIAFEISDSGIGISASQLQRIFEPFEQADSSTTRQFGGTGLGLAIVRRLVELMGGSISVSSEPGKGSTFSLHLDLAVAAPALQPHAPAATAAHDQSPFGRLKVLVVEDNLTNQLVATALLNSMGIDNVSIAENGHAAVAAATGDRFDLILMDVHMPVMDGCDATRALRRTGVATPIVAMTANVMPEDRATYLDAGMVDCLPKPMDRMRLRQLIEDYCTAASTARHD